MASSLKMETPFMEPPQKSGVDVTAPKSYPPPNNAARHSKRLTLNFPILPPPQALDDRPSPSPPASTPAASNVASPRLPPVTSPAEPTNFLTALAAQERRVLELREELQKAETELSNLKKQWAQQETGRKKNEIKHVVSLQPLSPKADRFDGEGEDALAPKPDAEKLERRATMQNTARRKPNQRVFSGSRHTRTLSLLSPGASANQSTPNPLPAPDDLMSPTEVEPDPPSVSRATTMPSVAEDAVATFGKTYRDLANARKSMPPASREVLVKTGKQMAADLKDGLWTFFEDIRQATVGEEGISGTENRAAFMSANISSGVGRQPSKATSRDKLRTGDPQKADKNNLAHGRSALKSRSDKKADLPEHGSFWGEFGLDTPQPKKQIKPTKPKTEPKKVEEQNLLDIDDNWDVWDSPQPIQKTHSPNPSSSTTNSRGAGSPSTTDMSSPRTSTSSAGDDTLRPDASKPQGSEQDLLPWPALTKLTPSKLTRTASNLMAEWERSLTPPPASTVQDPKKDD